MDAFVRECYDMGTCPMCLDGISAMRVGGFLVVNAYDVRAVHPGIDLEGMDEHRENDIRQGKQRGPNRSMRCIWNGQQPRTLCHNTPLLVFWLGKKGLDNF